MNNSKWIVAAVCLVLGGCGTPPEKVDPEICTNGIDDDKNGFADCADSACFTNAACESGQVIECTTQAACIGGKPYDYFTRGMDPTDGGTATLRPIPICTGQKCVVADGQVSVRIDVKTNAYIGLTINSVNTRFVKKAAVDGAPVTCATLTEVAGSNAAAADAIEASNKFNLQGWDLRSTSQGTPGGTAISLNMDVNTGADFLIWVELWSGKVDSNVDLPTGKRYGFACVETGLPVDEVTAADHNVRAISITMPTPQNP